MKKFKVGDQFETTCIFTGGSHTHTVTEIKNDQLICNATYYEMDGTHEVTESFDIHTDKKGEYIVSWTYKGHEGRVYAETE